MASLLVLATIITTNGCQKKNSMEENAVTTNQPSSMNYLALGDSYTIGQSVEANERFPYFLTQLLRQQAIQINDPEYIATTGWTTANLQSAIAAKGNLGTYDLVTLLIGVNDQYQHLDTAGYRTRFVQLLEKSIVLAGNRPSRVFVFSIPDYSATPFVPAGNKKNVSTEIDAFNKINYEITKERGVAYIDITPLTREAATDASLVASDGLHYSGKEHKLWAEKAAPIITKVLQ